MEYGISGILSNIPLTTTFDLERIEIGTYKAASILSTFTAPRMRITAKIETETRSIVGDV